MSLSVTNISFWKILYSALNKMKIIIKNTNAQYSMDFFKNQAGNFTGEQSVIDSKEKQTPFEQVS